MPGTVLVVHSDPDILEGTVVFVGTRVPFRNLFKVFTTVTAISNTSRIWRRRCAGILEFWLTRRAS